MFSLCCMCIVNVIVCQCEILYSQEKYVTSYKSRDEVCIQDFSH